MSRLICGGNLISGYAHSRDLIYVSNLLKHYFTDDKIIETWALCEQHGVNTMIFNPADGHALEVYHEYRKQGGRIQYLAQVGPQPNEFQTVIKQVVDDGAVGAFLVGNLGDEWTRDNQVGQIGELVALIKAQKLIAGVGGHKLRTVTMVEKAGVAPRFLREDAARQQLLVQAPARQTRTSSRTTASTITGARTRSKRFAT